ncbi:MAG: alpha/beta hydrolase [Firmicutes bacterium]|nr:alpha/beta hydrolase [Bacillota bacterium]
MFRAKNGKVQVGGSDMHYNVFGKGTEDLVIIPGLGDGLRTVKGMAIVMATVFRSYGREHKVWLFSRKDKLEANMSTRDMARDLAEAMDQLDIKSAKVMGVSQGGMISQWLAVDFPQKVRKLAIVVSVSRQNETLQRVVNSWIEMAEQKRYGDLAVDTMLKTYSEKGLKKWRPFFWLVKMTGKPQSQERFLIQANSCLTHNAYPELSKIQCPTLVIGGAQDNIVGGEEVQKEMAEAISNSQLHIYPELGHGAYEEAKDFNNRVLEFFKS